MVVFESIVGATMSSFLVPIISRPFSRNKSSKIRAPLTEAKKTVLLAMETLRSVQQMLDEQMYNSLFDDCEKTDMRIDDLLDASNEDMNILTKTRRYRGMVNQARNTHDTCLRLASRVQKASLSAQKESLNAQKEERNKPANVIARTEEAIIATLDRKTRLYSAIQRYKEVVGPTGDSGLQSSFTLNNGDTTDEAEHVSTPDPQTGS